jgi:signal transduction histidine kinase
MIFPKIPENEKQRIEDLFSYNVLDTLEASEYDDITHIASLICDAPISLISLIDDKRQWFKSHYGLAVTETPKELAFCAHAINEPNNILMVPDSRTDERFFDNPLVTSDPFVIFYAGVPLISSSGFPLGTLCVIDNKPKTLNEEQIKSLKALSNQVITILELRKSKRLLTEMNMALVQKNQTLEQFAMIAANDINSPLRSISSLIELFWGGYSSSLDKEGVELFKLIDFSTNQLRNLIDGIIDYTISDKSLSEQKEKIQFVDFVNEVVRLLDPHKTHQFTVTAYDGIIELNSAALKQILINLISNAIKYNDKENTEIEIGFSQTEDDYCFFVKDNGSGIPAEKVDSIFDIFQIGQTKDRYGKRGSGIGLATVKKLVEGQKGTIKVESEINKGSKFSFNISK